MLLMSSSSKTILKENLRRYWPVPVIAIMSYILFGLVPIIMSYDSFMSVAYYAQSLVSGSGFVMNMLITIFAVASSYSVFAYLHDPVSSNAMHAMPANRRKLFASSAFSGWLMSILPILIMSFLMLMLRGARTDEPELYGRVNTEIYGAKEIFTFAHSMQFLAISLVTATFVYAVCCLAAVLAGQRGIHFLLGIFLVVLPLLLVLEIDGLCSELLYGFNEMNVNYNYLSPLSYAMTKEAYTLDHRYLLYYLVISVILFILAYYIYTRIKLERIGQATTFPFVGDFLCVLITFMLALGISNVIISLSTSSYLTSPAVKPRFIITSFITSIIVYALMRMIADSTVSVFNLKNLKKFGVYLIVFVAFMALTVFDVTGFQNRLPDRSDIKAVDFHSTFAESVLSPANGNYADDEAIDAIYELHRSAVDNADAFTREINNDDLWLRDSVNITWQLRNGSTMSRQYMISYKDGDPDAGAAFKKLYNSREFKSKLQIDVDEMLKRITKITVNEWGDDKPEKQHIIKKEDWRALLETINKDLEERTYEEYIGPRKSVWIEAETKRVDYMTIYMSIGLEEVGMDIYSFDENTRRFVSERN